MEDLKSLITELERATGELANSAGENYSALAAPMRRRSEAILKLARRLESTSETLDEECRNRLRRQRRAGLELLRKIRISRAGVQSEFARLIADSQLLQSFPRHQAKGGLVDCSG